MLFGLLALFVVFRLFMLFVVFVFFMLFVVFVFFMLLVVFVLFILFVCVKFSCKKIKRFKSDLIPSFTILPILPFLHSAL